MSFIQWVDKYKPQCSKDIIGNKITINKINEWLKVFRDRTNVTATFKNAILLSGPPGIGKTTMAHILLKEADYDVVEFNASELRTSKIISSKLKNIISGNSVKMMFNKNIRTGVIMDEIDGIESKKECSSNDLIEFINYTNIQHQKKIKKENKIKKKKIKKLKTVLPNKNPIICICNFINKSVNPLLKEVLHFKLKGPSEKDIYDLLFKINKNENIGINDQLLNLIIPYCQNDLRRTIYIMQYINSFNLDKKIINNEILKIIQNIDLKNIDYGLYDSVNMVLCNYDINMESLMNCYYTDQNFIPFIIHENFINFVQKNSKITYSEKIDTCLDYYKYLEKSQILKKQTFNKWFLNDYIALFTCVAPNFILKDTKLKETLTNNISKSALISKYNYRYYNLKSINLLCKKLKIDINNFQFIATIVVYTVFEDRTNLNLYLRFLKENKVIFKEFEKIMKLSTIYKIYSKNYTKKYQKNLLNIFDKIEID